MGPRPGLRHTHAAELAKEGHPINLVQAQLGHGSLATIDRYLRHIAPTALVRPCAVGTGRCSGAQSEWLAEGTTPNTGSGP